MELSLILSFTTSSCEQLFGDYVFRLRPFLSLRHFHRDLLSFLEGLEAFHLYSCVMYEYILTTKGKELLPLLIALTQWGDKWIYGEGKEPIIILDKIQGQPISAIRVHAADGRELRPRDMLPTAGPGAGEEARQRLKELEQLAHEIDQADH